MLKPIHSRIATRLLYAAAVCLALWLCFSFVFPWLLPFILSFAVARIVQPPITLLSKKLRISRAVSAAVVVLLTLFVFVFVIGLIFWRIFSELYDLAHALPDFLSALPDYISNVMGAVNSIISAFPVEFQDFARTSVSDLLAGGMSVPHEFYLWLAGFLGGFASSLPSVIMFTVTSVLSTFFISRDYKAVTSFIVRQFPESLKEKLLNVHKHMVATVGKWLRAEAILISLTFGQLLICFMIIRQEYALLLAALIALLDALPMIGAAMLLLPWGVISIVSGNYLTGCLLLLTLVSISLVRSLTEPQLIGGQLGLPALVVLMSMYVGFQLMGIIGIFLFPIFAVTARQLHDWNYIKLWKD